MKKPIVTNEGFTLTPIDEDIPPGEFYLGNGYLCDCNKEYHWSEPELNRCRQQRGVRNNPVRNYITNECKVLQWFGDELSIREFEVWAGDKFDNSSKPEVDGQRLFYKDWALKYDGGIIVLSERQFNIMFTPAEGGAE